MVDEETITTRYRNASLRGKIDIILNYYPGFEEMLQGLRGFYASILKQTRCSAEGGNSEIQVSGSGNPDMRIQPRTQRSRESCCWMRLRPGTLIRR